MIMSILYGTIDHISEVINRGENFLPYRTVHMLRPPKKEEGNEFDDLNDELMENEIASGIITREQAEQFMKECGENFQKVIVFFNYNLLDNIKTGDLVQILFDPYDEPLGEGSIFNRNLMNIGIYISKNRDDFDKAMSEKLDEYEKEFIEQNRENIRKMFEQ